MSLTTKNAAGSPVEYSLFRVEGNRATYIGDAHSDLIKDQIILTSASPKQSRDTYGNRRTSLNVVRTIKVATPLVDTTVARDMKLEPLASVPVGATFEEFQELSARAVGLLEDPIFLKSLYLTGQIDFH
jgi:hypothetical protein